MRSKLGVGIVAGLAAGVVFGILMSIMRAPTEGGTVPMMVMVAKILRSESMVVGWVYHLFNSAVIGALFGVVLGDRSQRPAAATGWGTLYGIAWWVLGGLILMPVLLGMDAFAPIATESMRPVAFGSLIGHLIYGLVLGGGYWWLHKRAPLAKRQRLGRMGQAPAPG